MKKTALLIACAGLIVGGMSLAAPEKASAGIRVSFGKSYGGGYGFNRGYSNFGYRNFGYSNFGYRNYGYRNFGWGGGRGRGHYDHCDYGPRLVPHGNHFHIVPGRPRIPFGGHAGHHH